MSTNPVQTKLRSEENEKLLMEQIKKCKREIATLIENNLKLQKENGLLKEKLKMHKSSDEKVKELQENISDLQKKQPENTESLSRLQEQNKALKKENKTLCDKNAIQTSWREQLARELEGFDKLKKEAKIITSDLNQLKHQHEDLEVRDRQNQNKIRDLQDLLHKERTKSTNVQEALNNEKLSSYHLSEKMETLTSLNNTVQILQSEKHGLLGELNKSRNQEKSLKEHIEKLTEEIRRESVKNRELSGLVEMKTSESDKLQRELGSKDAHIHSLEEEAVKARKIIDGMQMELKKLHHGYLHDLEKNAHMLSTLNQENQSLKKEGKEREEKEQKLVIQVSTLENQILHVEGKLCNTQKDLQMLEKENASLEKINKSLDHETGLIKAEMKDVRSKNRSLTDHLEQTKKQMEAREAKEKEKVAAIHRELTEVREMVSVTEAERRRLAKELEDRQQADLQNSTRLHQLENQKGIEEEKVSELTEENKNLREENKSLRGEIKKLSEDIKKLKQFQTYWLFLSKSLK